MNVLLNGVVVAANLQLVNAGASINMTLQSGENALDIEALGVGDIPPNTAAFTVTDTNGLELGEWMWYMEDGEISRLIVIYSP